MVALIIMIIPPVAMIIVVSNNHNSNIKVAVALVGAVVVTAHSFSPALSSP